MNMQMIKDIKALMSSKSPQEALINMVGNTNPMMKNLMEMANKGDKQSLENFAKNICKERGIDYDKEFANFMSNFK